MKKLWVITILAAILSSCAPAITHAQEVVNDYQGTYRAKVLEIIKEETKEISYTNTPQLHQTIQVQVLSGPQKGQTVTMDNDYMKFKKGTRFYFNYIQDVDGTERYSILNIDRHMGLLALVLVFIAFVVIFGGWQGVRSLLALIASFLGIIYILMPGLLHGWNPFFASFLVAAGILFFAIFFTHGFNRESLVAYSGTMIAVMLTGVFAIIAVHLTHLSGYTGEESIYLNFSTRGTLDMTGLLLGAIIIGVLGVLDDIAVTQAAVVTELYNSNTNLTRTEIYRRAIRVGREHVGALVNTLVLAYTGASLPLMLYFYLANAGFLTLVNLETFATEIVRTIVGSIGLIMTVPLVTLLAVFFLKNYKPKHHEHSHSHGHGHHH